MLISHQHQPRGKAGSVHPKYQITAGPGLIKTVLLFKNGNTKRNPDFVLKLPLFGRTLSEKENAEMAAHIPSNRSYIERGPMQHRGFLFMAFICLVFWIQLACL